eukprot:g2131.t1
MYCERGSPDRLYENQSEVGSGFQFLELEAQQFFNELEAQRGDEGGPYHYFTSVVDDFIPNLSETGCKNWQDQIIESDIQQYQWSSPAYPSIWIGGNGSTTQCHYDVSNNFFSQLHGRKRFRIWSPEHHFDLCVFPDAHIKARKSQLFIDNCLDSIPEPMMDVVLAPGDSLIIPAFFFHHVEALEGGVSVNVFSESSAKLSAQAILAAPLPQVITDKNHDIALTIAILSQYCKTCKDKR